MICQLSPPHHGESKSVDFVGEFGEGKRRFSSIWFTRTGLTPPHLRNTQNSNPKKKGFFDGQAEGNNASIFNKSKYLPACQQLPFLINDICCSIMKKKPLAKYGKESGKKAIVGTLAEESMLRTQSWLKSGCNAFDGKNAKSQPLSFWTEQDILQYIKENNLPIANCYGEIVTVDKSGLQYGKTLCDCGKLQCSGCQRTGCSFCAYGAGNEHKKYGKSRYEILAETQPKLYDYIMRGGEWADNPYYDATAPEIDPVDGWKNWNVKKIWQPSANGLGMKFVFDEVNQIYGKDYIKYR